MLPSRETYITADDAFNLLDRAVAERGEKHRYPKAAVANKDGSPKVFHGDERDRIESSQCHYFATERDAKLIKGVEVNAPMCIVGWVFDALGVDRSDLGHWNNIQTGVEGVIENLQLTEFFDDRAVGILAMAQEQQDGGLTWGQAVQVARNYHTAVEAS